MIKTTRFLNRLALLFGMVLLLAAGCKKDKDDTTNTPKPDDPCKKLHPVVFIHGFLASGDTWANQVMRFTSNGYCDNLLYAYDWNSVGGGNDQAALNTFIDTILARTGATQVDLVGHSAGGGYGYAYCEDTTRAKKVAHYVHIGSSAQTSPAGVNDEVPTLNISSAYDAVAGSTSITGATNVTLAGADHYQVATGAEAFAEMYKFFNGGTAPANTAITAQSTITVSGKAVTLGENSPIDGGTIHIYEVNPDNGSRLNASPDFTLTTTALGTWGPQAIKINTKYEFEIISNRSGDRIIHYYREAFTHTNPLVYLRTIPTSGLAGTLLGGLSKNDNQSVLAVFTANQATVAGRDSLIVDNVVLSTNAITPASKTIIAMFLFDDNNNQQSDYTTPGLFGVLPNFLTARDMYFQTNFHYAVPLRFNGRYLFVPNLKSESEGVIVAVFD
ncbi:MAG: alpha/beta fold hydrolase [Chitinophagales bacterium]|nr:alpha/beta fold hydrolase [Chitinophagales bacterium]